MDDNKSQILLEILKTYKILEYENELIRNMLKSFYNQNDNAPKSQFVNIMNKHMEDDDMINSLQLTPSNLFSDE